MESTRMGARSPPAASQTNLTLPVRCTATPTLRRHISAFSRPLSSRGTASALRSPCPTARGLGDLRRTSTQQQARKLRSVASASSVVAATAAAPEKPEGFKWGADMKLLGVCLAVGVGIWFAPAPQGVTPQAWHLLAIFVSTIVGIITTPLPLGAVAMLGLGATMLTKTLTFSAAFSAFTNEIPWLIAIAFWLSRGFIDSGLGRRVAYTLVSMFGKTTLGLTYSLVLAEALLAPAIPSVAARSGGIFFPLARALCESCGSKPSDGTQNKMGAYVMKTCFQTSTISSAMFITAMAANPLAVDLATQSLGYPISWGTWALAGLVPGVICLISAPLILYVLYPPEMKQTPEAPAEARQELEKLGPLSTKEKLTTLALAVTVSLWIFGGQIGIGNVAAALLGLGIMLVTNVTTWDTCLAQKPAWDTLTWFAALIGMASYLNKLGFIKWFSGKVVGIVNSFGMSWQPTFAVIVLFYFYSHYLFASGAAHIGAMYTAFLSVAIAAGAPALPAALLLAQLSNVMGCLTPYGIGSAPPYFGAGYVSKSKWYTLGFIMSVFYITVWMFAGGAWWKVLGMW